MLLKQYVLLSFLFLILLSSCAETPESIHKQIEKKIIERDNTYKEYCTHHISFNVQGEIRDRNNEQVSIWGTSWAELRDTNLYCDMNELNVHMGSRWDKSNIIVIKPLGLTNPRFYSSQNNPHYFVKKTTGRNAFRMEVPVYVFTTETLKGKKELDEKIAQLEKNLDELSEKLRKIDPEYFNKLYPPANAEIGGIKYSAVIEKSPKGEYVYIGVDGEMWKAISDNKKQSFMNEIAKKGYGFKNHFTIRSRTGGKITDLAEYKDGAIRLFAESKPEESTKIEESLESQPSQSSIPSRSFFNEELLGVKFIMTVENGIVYCIVDDSWNSISDKDRRDFLKQVGQKKYFGKTQFTVKNSGGTNLAEYSSGKIKIFKRQNGEKTEANLIERHLPKKADLSVRDEQDWQRRIDVSRSQVKYQEARVETFKKDLEIARRNPREARDSESSLRNILEKEEKKLEEVRQAYLNLIEKAKNAGAKVQ